MEYELPDDPPLPERLPDGPFASDAGPEPHDRAIAIPEQEDG